MLDELQATSPLVARPGGAGRTYGPGEVLGRRYRVVRFIARGGMGEVYEVEDLHLGVRVALKTIRPEAGLDARMLERFRREVLLARQVTHPNVCRIFDLGSHEEEGGFSTVFLTMELLEGETLADRLRRVGSLPAEEVLPLLRQIVSGLQAAHDAGVVHRDLKTRNLMLQPMSGGGERVVITDFGLARHVEGVGGEGSTVAAMVGTPAYMAPEQVEGAVAGPAADVYALGVVLYEALAGERPFSAQSPVLEAMKRLTETPLPPSRKVPGVPPQWEQAVLRCLARRPEERFARVEDVLAAVEAPPSPVARRRWWPWLGAAAVVVVALGAVAAWQLGRHRGTGADRAAPDGRVARRCVAVLGLKNLAGRPQDAWIGTALGQMLASELAAGERLRLLPGETAARLRSDLELSEGELLAPETLRRLSERADVDIVLAGSYLAAGVGGGSVRLDLHLQDAATGEAGRPVIETGSVEQLAGLASSVGATLRARLGVEEASPEAAAAARAAYPSRPDAARLYAEGVARLWVLDAIAARDLLQQAVACEPDHPVIHSALGQAYSAVGQVTPALEAARRAFETSAGLPREQRLAIEATYRALNKEPARAVEILKALRTFFPDDLEHGIRLAEALVQAGKPVEAYAVLDELGRLPAPLGDDPRIGLAEAAAADAAADYARCLRVARAAAAGAQARDARLLMAQALTLEGLALSRLGRPEEAAEPVARAVATFAAVGDRFREARAAYTLGVLNYDRGELRQARAAYERSLSSCLGVENPECALGALYNLTFLSLAAGEMWSAEVRLLETRAAAESSRTSYGMMMASLTESVLRSFQGRLDEARVAGEDALGIAQRDGDRLRELNTQWALAEIDLLEGDVAAGARRSRATADGIHAVGVKMLEVIALTVLGRCRLAADELDGAAAATVAATRLGEEIGNRLWGAHALAAQSDVELAAGNAAAAERSARAGLAMLGDEPAVWVKAQLELALTAALLGQGQADAAVEASSRARVTAAASHVPQLGLQARTRFAEVNLARGKVNEAAAELGGVVVEAHGLGMLPLELEARMLLGRARLEQGLEAEGHAALEAVASEAAARGLARLARLARQDGR